MILRDVWLIGHHVVTVAHVSYVPYNIHPIVHITPPPITFVSLSVKSACACVVLFYPVPPTLNKILLTYLLTYLLRPTLSRWRPIKEKLHVPFFSKCRNFVNNSRNCTKFEVQGDHGCPFDSWYLNLDVTKHHDLFVTFTIFQKLWRKWTLAQKCWFWNGVIWGNRN